MVSTRRNTSQKFDERVERLRKEIQDCVLKAMETPKSSSSKPQKKCTKPPPVKSVPTRRCNPPRNAPDPTPLSVIRPWEMVPYQSQDATVLEEQPPADTSPKQPPPPSDFPENMPPASPSFPASPTRCDQENVHAPNPELQENDTSPVDLMSGPSAAWVSHMEVSISHVPRRTQRKISYAHCR